MAKILIVEDNSEQALMIAEYLAIEHHRVESVGDGIEAMERLQAYQYDLIILDWELPGMSGLEICKRFRQERGLTPIIMLTGKSLIREKEAGFDSGADDYLPKPFNIRELGARVRAMLRRAAASPSNVLRIRDIELDVQKFLVTRKGKEIRLVAREFSLLEFFMRHPDQVFSSEALLQRVWHSESDATQEALRTCLTRLRKKLEDNSDLGEELIVTVHGVGYKLRST